MWFIFLSSFATQNFVPKMKTLIFFNSFFCFGFLMVLYLLSGAIIGCIFIISINISIYELIYQHRSQELKNNLNLIPRVYLWKQLFSLLQLAN